MIPGMKNPESTSRALALPFFLSLALFAFFSSCSPTGDEQGAAPGEPTPDDAPLWGLNTDDDFYRVEEFAIEAKSDLPGLLVYPSPDGRYAISWPDIDTAKKQNFEVSNHLVDLQTGRSIGTLAEEDGDFENRNHGGMGVLWRSDSRAFVYRLEGKWAPRRVGVMEIDAASGEINEHLLNLWVAEAFGALMSKEAPEFWHAGPGVSAAEYLDCNIGCAFDESGKVLAIQAQFEMNPKQIPGQTYAAGWLTGTYDLGTGKLHVKEQAVTEAKRMKEEE
jgi:hypothetical protein